MKITCNSTNFFNHQFRFTTKGIGSFNVTFTKDKAFGHISVPISKDLYTFLENEGFTTNGGTYGEKTYFNSSLFAQGSVKLKHTLIGHYSPAEMKKLYKATENFLHRDEIRRNYSVIRACFKKFLPDIKDGVHFGYRMLVTVDLDSEVLKQYNELLKRPFNELVYRERPLMAELIAPAIDSIVVAKQLFYQEIEILERTYNASSKIAINKLIAKRDKLAKAMEATEEPVTETPTPF